MRRVRSTGEGTWDKILYGKAQWCVIAGDCRDLLDTLPDKSIDHVITDPPYSAHVHNKSRGAGYKTALGHPCVREREFGFDCMTQRMRRAVSQEVARLCRRWSLVFSDLESVHLWRRSMTVAGVEPLRTGIWVKEGCTPQFTGDRPAVAAEAIVISHPRGKKRWNGGGSRAIWTHAIVGRGLHNSGADGKVARVHTAQKPLALMLELVSLFTDEGDLVLDCFSGSGTTGVACLRLGRRYIGIELNAEWAEMSRERLRAEESDSTLAARRAGQMAMFGGSK